MSYPIYGELSCEFGSKRELGELGRSWLEAGLANCARRYLDQLASQPSQLPYGPSFRPAVPGGIVALMRLDKSFSMGHSGIASYTEEGWRRLLDVVCAGDFFHAEVQFLSTDSTGGQVDPYLHIAIRRIPELAGWVHLTVASSEEWLNSHPDDVSPLVDLMFDTAGRFDASFGNWTRDGNFRTEHEQELRVFPDQTLPVSRKLLRGFSWLTVLPPEVAEKAGGLDAFEGSKKFHRVQLLANGGLGLLATKRVEAYGFEDAARIAPSVGRFLVSRADI